MAKVKSEKAFELMYQYFKAKQWLNKPEDEALSFLLTLETAKNWGDCTESSRKVVNSLLIDFTAKLRGPMAYQVWEVPDDLPKWRQAAKIISDEIRRSHLHFASSH